MAWHARRTNAIGSKQGDSVKGFFTQDFCSNVPPQDVSSTYTPFCGTPTPTPTPTPPAQSLNVSTRLDVGTGDKVSIGGIIITLGDAKRVLLRAIGPSLANFGITDPLTDPVLELHAGDGSLITSNDNWKDSRRCRASRRLAWLPPTTWSLPSSQPSTPASTPRSLMARMAGPALAWSRLMTWIRVPLRSLATSAPAASLTQVTTS